MFELDWTTRSEFPMDLGSIIKIRGPVRSLSKTENLQFDND